MLWLRRTGLWLMIAIFCGMSSGVPPARRLTGRALLYSIQQGCALPHTDKLCGVNGMACLRHAGNSNIATDLKACMCRSPSGLQGFVT